MCRSGMMLTGIVAILVIGCTVAYPTTDVDETGNDFVNCMARCLGKSVADIEKWMAECGRDPKCWGKKVGFAALKCVPKCVSFEVEFMELEESTERQEQHGLDDALAVAPFVKCMASCLGKSVADIEKWVKQCGKSAKCWAKKVGLKALKCVPKCLKLDEVFPAVEHTNDQGHDLDTVDATPFALDDAFTVAPFVKCMASCLGKSVADIEKWVKQCGKNAKCWAKKVGLKALKCVPKCLKFDEISHPEATELEISYADLAPVVDVPSNDRFANCMAKCMGKSIDDIEKWISECGTDVNCWLKKAGFAALKCVPKCITVQVTLIQTDLMFVTSEDIKSNGFGQCMADCASKSLEQIQKWIVECNINWSCWIQKIGFAAAECLTKCGLGDKNINPQQITRIQESAKDSAIAPFVTSPNNRFADCLAKCVGKSVAEIERWIAECGTDVNCWLKKLGFSALKCVPRCIKMEISSVQVELEIASTTSEEDQRALLGIKKVGSSRFEKCMAQCLGTSIGEIEQWVSECGSNVSCWLKKVGFAALKCVPKCIQTSDEQYTVKTDILPNLWYGEKKDNHIMF
ncbi:unnamed protein product [Owenia fusiformis]|uniref:Uncharacterized protein n=1 Tax=Owenia fusiformis TaxID=6347 RepID=A0A8J1UYT0_OWEFU|nr:unnamed protein product [Owenia fusiformis]